MGVLLTKDNLVRHNWNGNKYCCFCHFPETVKHLLIDCVHAKLLWRAVHLLFGLPPPSDIFDLFSRWSKIASKKYSLRP
jgi:hypothetical protein